MNTEELMIGDWVYNAHHNKNIRITPYDFFMHGHDAYGKQYLREGALPQRGSDLIHIPLTEEILRKNGLSKEEHYFKEDEHCDVELYLDEGRVMWTINCCEYDIKQLKYVHELQHVLKMFGINKEITI